MLSMIIGRRCCKIDSREKKAGKIYLRQKKTDKQGSHFNLGFFQSLFPPLRLFAFKYFFCHEGREGSCFAGNENKIIIIFRH